MTPAASLITVQFLTWLAERPRSYAEVMDAWRTSCPRLSVWEDASLDGLVQLADGGRQTVVRLTDRGAALLRASAAAGHASAPVPTRTLQKVTQTV